MPGRDTISTSENTLGLNYLSEGSGDRQACHQQVSWQGQHWQGQPFLPANHVRGWGEANKKHEIVVITVSWFISQCNNPMFTNDISTPPLCVSLWQQKSDTGTCPFSPSPGHKGKSKLANRSQLPKRYSFPSLAPRVWPRSNIHVAVKIWI